MPLQIKVKMNKGGLMLLFLLLVSGVVQAQEFGGNPPSVNWKQINTDTARVIFPEGMEAEAQRTINTIHYLNRHNRSSIGAGELKLDLVLQNQTITSNGYVGLAPFRSEFQLSAPQRSFSLGSLNWLDLLSIHEYRHALQNMNSRNGISRLFYYLAGQLGWAGAVNLSVPNWFWEGDAVMMETLLTNQGRGRLPAFFNGYRSLLLHDTIYHYSKARNGSLKDFVPNHYELGYLLTRYGREEYSPDFWKGVFRDATSYSPLFYPFSGSIRRRTGMNVKQFYRAAMNKNQERWKAQVKELEITPVQELNSRRPGQTVTNYEYPVFEEDGNLIVMRSSFKEIATFYRVTPDGSEERLFPIGITFDNYFSLNQGKLVWAELDFHERWGWREFSVIKGYDLKSGRKWTIAGRSRYYSPDIHAASNRVVVFEATPDLDFSLKVIDATDGSLLKTLPNPQNLIYTYPKWTENGEAIISAARTQTGEMALVEQDLTSGEFRNLTPYTNHVIGIPHVTRDFVLFTASYSGIDNIYAVARDNGQLYRVNTRKLGVYQPAVSNDAKYLVFSEFSKHGYDLKRMPFDPEQWEPYEIIPLDELEVFRFSDEENELENILDNIPSRKYQVTDYPYLGKLINPHSWIWSFFDPNFAISLQSNNVLNTFAAEGSVLYNRNENAFGLSADATYGGFFPYINAGFSSRFGRSRDSVWVQNQELFFDNQNWNDYTIYAGLSVPLNLTSGLYLRELEAGVDYQFIMVDYTRPVARFRRDFEFHSLKYFARFANIRKRARQNIFPNFAQAIELDVDRPLDDTEAGQFTVKSDFAFPGIFANHNLLIQADYQVENYNQDYYYIDNFFYARGYGKTLGVDDVYRLSFNYHFPIYYPDFGLAGILYFYRIRGNLFYDHSESVANIGTRTLNFPFRSAGVELIADVQLLNAVPLNFGIRVGKRFDGDRKIFPEFFFPLVRF